MTLSKVLHLLHAVFILIQCFSFQQSYRQSGRNHGINSLISTRSKQTTATLHMNLAERIRDSVLRKYDANNVKRVIGCWNNFIDGKKLERYLDGDKKKVLQTADCFIEDLNGATFFDTSIFPWIPALEANYQTVLQELVQYEAGRRGLQVAAQDAVGGDLLQQIKATGNGLQGDGEWLGPRDTSGNHYGPEWKTLGLQDRSVWSADLTSSFPKTIQLLTSNGVPSCEVFFAKQGARSGLKPHSDKNNFIVTCHLALDVPEGDCWIKVGDATHYWRNGKTCVFDTSVIHSTENKSDRVRYVLLIRMWHPELTATEIDAFKFIFGCLDHAAEGEEALEQYEMRMFLGQDNHAGLNIVNPAPIATSNIATAVANKRAKNIDSASEEKLFKKKGKAEKEEKKRSPSKGFGAK